MAAEAPRGWYSEAKVATARRNIERFDWARAQRDSIVARAEQWLTHPEEQLLRIVPPPEVARAYRVHAQGCPIHGPAANQKAGDYHWPISLDEPYKVKCPVGGEVYPSNDFEAYLASGMQDKTLLTGDYPDDGYGYRKEGVEHKYWFVGYWTHWAIRYWLHRALEDLSLAYLLTDDPRYAHVCALLLWRMAEYYPDYNYETQSRYGTEFQPTYKGRMLYHTWETWTVQQAAPAYDAIRPAIEDDAALQAFTGQSAEQIRSHIEERLLRTMADDITGGSLRIQGNYGMHQVGLLRVAAALAHTDAGAPTSKQMVDWVLHNDQANQYTSMALEDALANLVLRDGYPFESPAYNLGWVRDLVDVGEALEAAGTPVFDHPRFRRLLSWPLDLAAVGELGPPLGDSNNLFAWALGFTPDILQPGLRLYGDPRFARALAQAGKKPVEDLFHEPIAETVAAALAAHPEPVSIRSALLPGVGHATLQTGNDANRTAVSVFYGYYVGHRHYDRLQTDVFSHRWDLTPDLGYPETADGFDPRRFGLFNHTVSHNTVMVDATRQADSRGTLHVWDPGEAVQTVEVSAEGSYPATSLYRRTLMLIDAAPDQAYVVDIFRVRGGRQHDWLVHGTWADFASSLPLPAPREGTLAGPDVPYGHFYDDETMGAAPVGSVSYAPYTGSGFQYLFNVQEAPLEGVATADWALAEEAAAVGGRPTDGIVLRAHLVGQGEQVLVADGKPQQRGNFPDTLKWVVRRRTGDGELESVFVTVYEPFKDTPFIRSVRPIAVEGEGLPVALEIDLGDKRHRVFSRIAGDGATLPDGLTTDARAAVFASDGDGWQPIYELHPRAAAEVAGVDVAGGTVTLAADALAGDPPAGAVALVDSGAHQAAVPIAEVRDARSFTAGDDLMAGQVTVRSADGATLDVYPPFVYFVEPGMTAYDAAGAAVGRVVSLKGGTLTLDRAIDVDALPTDEQGRRRLTIRVLGPGDRVTVWRSTRG